MSIQDCLQHIGLTPQDDVFSDCNSIEEEFKVIKKRYFKKVLVSHPDKGGDAEVFRQVQTSFEVLRDLYDKGLVSSFVINQSKYDTSMQYDNIFKDFSNRPTPSWEYYEAAAEEAVPTYKIELAKSNRSRCVAKGKAKKCESDLNGKSLIEKNDIRIGYFEKQSGQYIRFVHLKCWRVPSRVWLGLPNPDDCSDTKEFEKALLFMNELLLTGFSTIPKEKKKLIIAHVMEKENWARLSKKHKEKIEHERNLSKDIGNAGSSSSNKTNASTVETTTIQGTTAIVTTTRKRYVIPKPGKNGALSANSQKEIRFVMTGTFPELGGGGGLNLGKDKLKALITSFGGRVTSSVSGKTDILVVGKNPGFSKVSKARRQPNCKLMSLKDLTEYFEGNKKLNSVEPMLIENFSAGYGSRRNNYLGNGLASSASKSDLQIAQGLKAPVSNKLKCKRKQKASKKSVPAKRRKTSKRSTSTPTTKKNKDGNVKQERRKQKAKVLKGTSYKITCDKCGKDCSFKSFFIEKTNEDFCEKCLASIERKVGAAIEQKNGIAIE